MSDPTQKLRPFILTCDERLETFKKFVDSYQNVKKFLRRPIVFAGYNHPDKKTEYDQLISSLDPHVVISQNDYYDDAEVDKEIRRLEKLGAQRKKERGGRAFRLILPGSPFYWNKSYLNIQKIMTKYFPKIALENSNPNENIIFLEDDGIFSSQFPSVVQKVSQYLQSHCDFLTLYCPRRGYKTLDGLPQDDLVHPIRGGAYYGNICVALSRNVIEYLDQNWEDVEAYSTAWDIRWGMSLQDAGFRMYATRNTYVQHQVGYSTLGKKVTNQFSKIFIE